MEGSGCQKRYAKELAVGEATDWIYSKLELKGSEFLKVLYYINGRTDAIPSAITSSLTPLSTLLDAVSYR